MVRGFATLEDTLDQYFSPKLIEDGSGLRVRTTRKFRRMLETWCFYFRSIKQEARGACFQLLADVLKRVASREGRGSAQAA